MRLPRRDGLTSTVLRRVAVGLVILWAISLLVFLGTEALPGDAATASLGQSATPELVADLRAQFDLDRPILTRYAEWFSGFFHGDLGRSLPSGDPVSTIVGDKIRNTMFLAFATIILLVPLSFALGIASAFWRDRPFDHTVATVTLALIAIPEFVIGTLLAVVAAVWLGLLPAVSLVDPSRPLTSQLSIIVLPVAVLLAASVAQTTRMVRACMIDVLQTEYIEMARLKGVPTRRLLLRHAFPNALGPTIQVIALNVAWLAGGIVVVETVFQYSGVGRTLLTAVQARDLPTVQALSLLIAGVFVTVNLLADVAVDLANPRVRRAR